MDHAYGTSVPQRNLRPALTVEEIIKALSGFPPRTPVVVGSDRGGYPAVAVEAMWNSDAPDDQENPNDVWISPELPDGCWKTMEMRPWPEEKV